MVKVYGVSDDLVEIEGSSYWEDEIGCYDKDVRIWFCDGTVIRIRYTDGGIWRIEVEAHGTEKHRLDVCSGEDEDDYSDVFYIDAEIASHAVIDKEERPMRLIDAEKLYCDVKEHCKKLIDKGAKDVDVVDIAAEIVTLVIDAQTEFAENESAHTRQWISVRDRLPEEREKVIILLLDGQIFRAEIRKRELLPEWWYYYAADCIDMDELGYMYSNEGGNWWYGNPVTHWMPLPELPEEVAQ